MKEVKTYSVLIKGSPAPIEIVADFIESHFLLGQSYFSLNGNNVAVIKNSEMIYCVKK